MASFIVGHSRPPQRTGDGGGHILTTEWSEKHKIVVSLRRGVGPNSELDLRSMVLR